jgi:HEAT repeat protein
LDTRSAAAEALGEIGDARAVRPLCAALAVSSALGPHGNIADDSLTWFIVSALDRIGDARVAGPLRALRVAPNDFGPQQDTKARRQAIEALRKIGGVPD